MINYKSYHPVNAMEYPRYSGIRTFMRLPHVTDLSEDVDIAIVGVPFDTGGTYRVGARFGRSAIRDQSMMLRPYNPDLDVVTFDHCSCIDYGDLATAPGYLPESHQMITDGAAEVLANEGGCAYFSWGRSFSVATVAAGGCWEVRPSGPGPFRFPQRPLARLFWRQGHSRYTI